LLDVKGPVHAVAGACKRHPTHPPREAETQRRRRRWVHVVAAWSSLTRMCNGYQHVAGVTIAPFNPYSTFSRSASKPTPQSRLAVSTGSTWLRGAPLMESHVARDSVHPHFVLDHIPRRSHRTHHEGSAITHATALSLTTCSASMSRSTCSPANSPSGPSGAIPVNGSSYRGAEGAVFLGSAKVAGARFMHHAGPEAKDLATAAFKSSAPYEGVVYRTLTSAPRFRRASSSPAVSSGRLVVMTRYSHSGCGTA
jgi:hypothetical protein